MNILVSGLSGFIGNNWKKYTETINPEWVIKSLNRKIVDSPLLLKTEFDKINVFIHLAGKAHDLHKTNKSAEYYKANYYLTKKIFDEFIVSKSRVFIFLSSVKAAADNLNSELTELYISNPQTHYGKSKLLAEKYILNTKIPDGKRVYILRPCMIHGSGNKGNLNLVYNFVKKGLPWPLGLFDNKRSFCSIDNLCFVMRELIINEDISSGVYNVADDEPMSTTDVIILISKSLKKEPKIWYTPKILVYFFSKLGDFFDLPLNSERLDKLTENYVVSNKKILLAINKNFPYTSREGLIKTFQSFNN